MTVVKPGARAAAPTELSVGDLVTFEGCHQSRSGLLARSLVRGEVVAIWPPLGRIQRWRTAVVVEIRNDQGQVASFPLRRRDRVVLTQRPEPAPRSSPTPRRSAADVRGDAELS